MRRCRRIRVGSPNPLRCSIVHTTILYSNTSNHSYIYIYGSTRMWHGSVSCTCSHFFNVKVYSVTCSASMWVHTGNVSVCRYILIGEPSRSMRWMRRRHAPLPQNPLCTRAISPLRTRTKDRAVLPCRARNTTLALRPIFINLSFSIYVCFFRQLIIQLEKPKCTL